MKKVLGLLVTFVLSAFAGLASAAVPVAATAALASVETDGMAMVDLLWPVVAAFALAWALIKIFKKGVSKAV